MRRARLPQKSRRYTSANTHKGKFQFKRAGHIPARVTQHHNALEYASPHTFRTPQGCGNNGGAFVRIIG
jgi:hypothetical protein